MPNETGKSAYTCNAYREEMILLALKRRLHQDNLSREDRAVLAENIRTLEAEMGMD